MNDYNYYMFFCLIVFFLFFCPLSPFHPEVKINACAAKVTAFNPCIHYIALPPYNRTNAPSSECCFVYYSTFGNESSVCLCGLIREILIPRLDFDIPRIVSLASICSGETHGMVTNTNNVFLESFCSGSFASLPAMTTGPMIAPAPSSPNQHPRKALAAEPSISG